MSRKPLTPEQRVARREYHRRWTKAKRAKEKESGSTYHQRYYAENKDRLKKNINDIRIRRTYNIEPDVYWEAMAQPCAICGNTVRRKALDHDHKTGSLRGTLCHNHNVALGLFDDNTSDLLAAIQYINQGGTWSK